jgi:hypothetical protein
VISARRLAQGLAQLLAQDIARMLALGLVLLLAVAPAAAMVPAASFPAAYRCDGDLLEAHYDNGAVDAPAIANSSAGTVPGAIVLLEWRGLRLQLPRTNNAGAPSYTDGRWWWSLEDPAHPDLRERRGGIRRYACDLPF